jgi:hypothetical protein
VRGVCRHLRFLQKNRMRPLCSIFRCMRQLRLCNLRGLQAADAPGVRGCGGLCCCWRWQWWLLVCPTAALGQQCQVSSWQPCNKVRQFRINQGRQLLWDKRWCAGQLVKRAADT